jgi:hypothetical protein
VPPGPPPPAASTASPARGPPGPPPPFPDSPFKASVQIGGEELALFGGAHHPHHAGHSHHHHHPGAGDPLTPRGLLLSTPRAPQ